MIKLHMLGDYRLIANSQCCIALGCYCGLWVIHTYTFTLHCYVHAGKFNTI